jgi:alkylmercury lyase
MTAETALSVDAVDATLAAASPEFDEKDKRTAVAVVRLLASGEPAGVRAVAEATGLSDEHVERTLRSWPAVFRDNHDRVVGFWGLALSEMPHRIRHAGVDLFAWCAWDPLFLARVIGELEVATHDPATGELISYSIGADGTIADPSHPDSVLSFLRPDQPWDDNVMATFCHYVLQFSGPRSAQRWISERPGTFTITVDEALELARRHTARTFGSAVA